MPAENLVERLKNLLEGLPEKHCSLREVFFRPMRHFQAAPELHSLRLNYNLVCSNERLVRGEVKREFEGVTGSKCDSFFCGLQALQTLEGNQAIAEFKSKAAL